MSLSKKKLSEQEIDRRVIAEAEDDGAWSRPVRVARRASSSLAIPWSLAARAAFLARLHHQKSVDAWLMNVIRERVELEEAAFAGAKQALASKSR